MHKLKLTLSACLFVLVFSPLAYSAQPYWLVEEYLQLNPEQRPMMEQFNAQVSAPALPTSAKVERPIRIATIYPDYQISDYWRRSKSSFIKRFDQLEIDYELFSFNTKPTEETHVQELQIEEALSKDPDYLVFTLDVSKHVRMIERILTKGRPKLIIQNYTTPLKAWEHSQPFMYVGFDHGLGTKKLAKEIFTRLPSKPQKIGVLFRAPGYISDMRGNGFIHQMDEYGATLVDSYYTDSGRESSRNAAREMIKNNPDIDFIYATSTDVAFGAMDAIEEAGVDIGVNGWGGGSAELESIEQGRLDLTVMRINDDNGIAMAEAIKRDLEGKSVPLIFSGRFEIVSQTTPPATVEQLKKLSFQLSGYNR